MKEEKLPDLSIWDAIKFYSSFYKDQSSSIVKMFFLFIVKHGTILVIPIILKFVIDDFIPAKNITYIYSMIGVLAGLGIINFFFHRSFVVISTKMVKEVSRKLRNTLINKIQILRFQSLQETGSGKYFSKIMMDVENAEMFSQVLFFFLPASIYTFLFALTAMALVNSKVLLIFILVIPIHLMVFRYFKTKFKKKQYEARKAREDLSISIARMVETSSLTKVHGEEDYEKKKVDVHNVNMIHKFTDINKTSAAFGVIVTSISQIFQITVIAICAHLVIRDFISIGDLTLYSAYVMQMINVLSNLLNQTTTVTAFSEAISSLKELLENPAEEINDGKKELADINGRITFKNVSFSYGKAPVLHNISIDIQPGATIALVGPSGSGKTTFVNMVLGLLRANEGVLSIDDHDINDLNMKSIRKRMGVVTQDPIIFKGSVIENIAYAKEEFTIQEVLDASVKANSHEFIAELEQGYETIIGEHGFTLSGGQKQRISISRAIYRKPKLLFLDEATSALDPDSEKEVQKGIDSMIGHQTTIVIAHRLSTIFKADRILVFHEGSIVEDGSHNTLIDKKGIYADLIKTQLGINDDTLKSLKN